MLLNIEIIPAEYIGPIIIGHLNINSIRNKFEMLSSSVAQYVDILMLSETKLDSTFPSTQFLINVFSVPHRLDGNSKGGGISLYVRDKIIVLPLNRYSLPPHIEILFFELNLRNRKWLVCCSYNPHKNLIKEHLRVLTEGIQFYSKDYENILLMGDYNADITETNMSSFCEIYHLTDIIKQPTCFKNPSNPSCIDHPSCIFHKLIATVMKLHIPKQQAKIIKYRNYKGFNETKFRSELTNILDLNIHESKNIKFFKNIFWKVLNKHAPIKTKYG